MGKTVGNLDKSVKTSLDNDFAPKNHTHSYAAPSHTHTMANISDLKIKSGSSNVTTGDPYQSWAHADVKNNDIAFGGNYSGHTTTDANIVFASGGGKINMVIDGEYYANEGQHRVYHTGYKPSPSDIGAAASSHGTHVTFSTTAPKMAGTAAVGTETKVARGDHVHAAQTSVSGNAGTATKLATARNITIGNKTNSFNGTANIAFTLTDIGALSTAGGTVTGDIHIKNNHDIRSIAPNTTGGWANGYTFRDKDNTKTLGGFGIYGSGTSVNNLYMGYGESPWSSSIGVFVNSDAVTIKGFKMGTARTLTIGNTGKKFDGSANVSWTLSDIGAKAAEPTTFGLQTNYIAVRTAGRTAAQYYEFWDGGDAGWAGIKAGAIYDNNNRVYSAGNKPSLSDLGAAAASHGTHVTWSTTAPKVAGTAAVGSETKVARGDHVHAAQTSVSGNAGTATKLKTARTLTIGNTGKSFDGSANVSWTLNDIGAVARYAVAAPIGAAGKYFTIFEIADQYYEHQNNYLLSINRTYHSPNNESYIFLIVGAYQKANITQLASRVNGQLLEEVRIVMNATNASSTKISKIEVKLKDNPDYTNDWYATLTPLSYNATVPVCHDFIASDNTGTTIATLAPTTNGMKLSEGGFNGNASTATKAGKWSTARTLTIGNKGQSVDGSKNISWTLSDIGAQPVKRSINFVADHTTNWNSSSAMSGLTYAGGWHGAVGSDGYLSFGNSGNNIVHMFVDGDYYARENKKVFHEGNLQPTVAKLATARTLTIGSKGKTFDGSANVSWSLSEIGAAASSHTHTTINGVYTSNGGAQPPSYVGNGTVRFNMMNKFKGLNGLPTYADCILMDTYTGSDVPWVTGFGILKQSGDPRAFIAVGAKGNTTTWAKETELLTVANYKTHVTPSNIGAAGSSHGTHVTWSTTAPKVAGTAAVGTETKAARGDHVHAAQTSVSGNAGTATKLKTARTLTIGSKGKTFDGSADVSWTLAEIGAAASSHNHDKIVAASGSAWTTAVQNPSVGNVLFHYNVSKSAKGMFPNTNNANFIISLNKHSGNYSSQLGFNNEGNIYYRGENNTAISDSMKWKEIAFNGRDSSLVDVTTVGRSGSGTLTADTYASTGNCYKFTSTSTATTIYKCTFAPLHFGSYGLCVRLKAGANKSTSNIIQIIVYRGTKALKTVSIKGTQFTSTSQYQNFYTNIDYVGDGSTKVDLSVEIKSTTVSGVALSFDYARIEMMNTGVFL